MPILQTFVSGWHSELAAQSYNPAFQTLVAPSPGTRFGVYEILTLLGSVGIGAIYLAHDSKLGRDVTLKIPPATVTSDPDRVARFRREAQCGVYESRATEGPAGRQTLRRMGIRLRLL